MLPHRMTTATARLITGSTHCWPVHRITKPGEDHRGRNRGVGRHVEEGAADVDVVLRRARTALRSAPFTTIPTAATIMIVPPLRRRRDGTAAGPLRRRSRRPRPAGTSALIERREDRRLLEAVGEARRRSARRASAPPAQATTSPSTSERLCPASDSSAIELARKPKTASTDDESDVERDADGEGAA